MSTCLWWSYVPTQSSTPMSTVRESIIDMRDKLILHGCGFFRMTQFATMRHEGVLVEGWPTPPIDQGPVPIAPDQLDKDKQI